MKPERPSYRLTPGGAVLIAVTIAALLLVGLGPRGVQVPALVVAAVLAAGVVAGSGVGLRRSWARNPEERRADFRPEHRDPSAPADPVAEAELWREERERYREDLRG